MMDHATKIFLYKTVSVLIFGGFLMMVQPFSLDLYRFGFPVVLAGVIAFNIVDHLPARPKVE
ncbi:MAG: hypothetical protein HN403_14725 [Rhodospirillales bacterium]|jgi:hypothetical protein|nr:hypothetical protein [Rhodospirillales bacterium]